MRLFWVFFVFMSMPQAVLFAAASGAPSQTEQRDSKYSGVLPLRDQSTQGGPWWKNFAWSNWGHMIDRDGPDRERSSNGIAHNAHIGLFPNPMLSSGASSLAEQPVEQEPAWRFGEATVQTSQLDPKSSSSSFNWRALLGRTMELGRSSLGFCARYVRKALNSLLGTSVNSGPSACRYNERHLNNTFKRPGHRWVQQSLGSGPLPPGSVIVCDRKGGCNPESGLHGHIELVDDRGRIVSDHIQTRSYCTGHRYLQHPRVYTMVPQSMALLNTEAEWLELTLQNILAFLKKGSGNAQSKAFPFSPITVAVASEDLAAEHADQAEDIERCLDPVANVWQLCIKDSAYSSKAPEYSVYRVDASQKAQLQAESSGFPFSAISSLSDPAIRKALLDAYVAEHIEQEGRESVQKWLSQTAELSSMQIQGYLDAGFELPKDYRLVND